MQEFNLASLDKQNEILRNFPISSDIPTIDYGRYTSTSGNLTNKEGVVIDVTGAGMATVRISNNAGVYLQPIYTITVDGKQAFKSSVSLGDMETKYFPVMGTSGLGFRETSQAPQQLIPFRFKKSLKVEQSRGSSSNIVPSVSAYVHLDSGGK